MPFVIFNGELIPSDQNCLPTSDQGFLIGMGLFETIRVSEGKPLLLDLHFDRFYPSAHRLGLTPPPKEELAAAIANLVSKNDISEARLRITLTGGDSTSPSLLITTSPLPDYPKSAKVVTVPFIRNEKSALAGVKSTSYAENIIALRHARESGFHEAIFSNIAGNLCEGATTNIFVIFGERVLTPPLSSGCLTGTTRRLILDLGKQHSIKVEETDLSMPVTELPFVFLTSSLRGLQPVSQFDSTELPITHPVFEQLRELYESELMRSIG